MAGKNHQSWFHKQCNFSLIMTHSQPKAKWNVYVSWCYSTEGDMGGFWTPQHGKKINEHRITARKVNETPSPQLVFLAPWFVHLHLKQYFYTPTIFHKISTSQRFSLRVSILLMPVNQFSCSCEETLREARKPTKKKKRSLEREPLPQITLSFYMYLAHFSWCINPQTEALSWLEV